jgi:magnesium and cobalt transporter
MNWIFIRILRYIISFFRLFSSLSRGLSLPGFFSIRALQKPKDAKRILMNHLYEAEKKNVIEPDTFAMIEGAIVVSDMQVRDIMIPRSDIVFIEEDATPLDFLPKIIESGHSRFPVFDAKHESVIGILLAKDLLSLALDGSEDFLIREIIRPVAFIPESKRLNVLLREFRSRRNHLAVVVDEYSSISGLVTIEDVIEQIVGEIDDEHDSTEEDNIRCHRNSRYTVKARTVLEEFNLYFQTEWDSDSFETIGGLIISELGRLPRQGEEIDYRGFSFRVLRADRRRIRLLRVIPSSINNDHSFKPEESIS